MRPVLNAVYDVIFSALGRHATVPVSEAAFVPFDSWY